MRTKYILGALCLPGIFAACTNEDFLTENENQFAGRETVKMVLSANYGAEDQANTKMVNQNGTFLWDNTDVLGATLLNGDNDNIYSNNKFVNTLTAPSLNADFTTDATTVVGKYLFYYPYSTKMTTNVDGVQYSLAEPQEYDPTGEKMMKNNFMIAPRIEVDGNEPGTLTLPITLRSIYGYGELNLKLAEILSVNGMQSTSLSSVNIQKIIIGYGTASNVYKDGTIDMDKVPSVNLKAANLKGLREGVNDKYKGKSDEELTEILLEEADAQLTAYNENYTEGTILNLTQGTAPINQVSIACVTEKTPNGVALSKNGTFSTRVLLPTVASSDLTITVYTNVGKFTTTAITGAKIKPSHTINLANPNRTANGDNEITMAAFTTDDNVNAISEADFIASMQQFAGQSGPINVTVGNFDLTPAAINAIPSDLKINFLSSASFSGDMTLKNMTLKESTTYTVKSGKVTLQSVKFQSSSAFEVKGGELEVAGVVSGSNDAIYNVNGGKLTVNHKDNSGEAANTSIYTINLTKGSVDIETPVNITGNTFAVGASTTVNNNSTINKITSVVTKGVVNNNGTATVETNNGTINNDGVLTVTTNNATINQMSADAEIASCTTNSGTIVTVAGSETTVDTNSGEIIYVDGARIAVKTGTTGNVTYQAPAEIAATDLANLSAAITKITFTDDFTYNFSTSAANNETDAAELPDNVKSLEFKGDLTLGQNWSMANVTSISFTGASANVTGKGKTITGNSSTFTMTIGVAKNDAAGIAAVATDMYIGAGVTITKLSAKPEVLGGAKVWNDGTVEAKSGVTSPDNWKGNTIVADQP